MDHLLAGSFPHIRQLILRRYVNYVKGLVTSINPVLSGLSYWGVRTRCSATGRNVANIQEEFRVDPLKCDPGNIIVQKRAIPENSFLNIELLETLLNIRDAEQEPDIVSNMNTLIDTVCVS